MIRTNTMKTVLGVVPSTHLMLSSWRPPCSRTATKSCGLRVLRRLPSYASGGGWTRQCWACHDLDLCGGIHLIADLFSVASAAPACWEVA